MSGYCKDCGWTQCCCEEIKKTMKPFNLEKAKAGEPICTRAGLKAWFIAYVPQADKAYRVLCYVEYAKCVWSYSEDGLIGSVEYPAKEDLFMAPTKKTYWFASWPIIPGFTYRPTSNMYQDREKLIKNCAGTNDATIHSIEIEE